MKYLGDVLMVLRLIASRPFNVLLSLKFRVVDFAVLAKVKEVQSTKPNRLQQLVHFISQCSVVLSPREKGNTRITRHPGLGLKLATEQEADSSLKSL